MKITMQDILAHAPELAVALREEGAATASATAATAERERIQSVFAQSMPGHEALIQSLAFDGKTSGAEAAVAVLGAERTLRDKQLNDRRADAPAAAPHAAAPADTLADADSGTPATEAQAKAKWEASAELRKEFSSFGTYFAYCQAENKNAARK